MLGYQKSSGSDDDGVISGITTAVAIDRDKNSQHAVKWAADHLLMNMSNMIILVHVYNPTINNHSFSMTDGTPDGMREQMEAGLQQLYLPFRGFCARKGIKMKEVVLEDADISKALSEYISTNSIHNLVVGASSRNAISRKFKNPDVPTTLSKSAPDFCTVYVIGKGKVVTVRSASRPVPGPAPRPNTAVPPSFPEMELDDPVKTPFTRAGAVPGAAGGGGAGYRSPAPSYLERRSFERGGDNRKTPPRDRPLASARSAPTNMGMDFDGPIRPPRSTQGRDSISDSLDFNGLPPMEFGGIDGLEPSSISSPHESPRTSFSGQNAREVEAEMKRLKLELKQTMDMYSTACKEAISAKQKAQELHQWKVEEARRFEQARHAEEAALAMAEMEKVKCQAAIEAAEAARRLAELEGQKRKSAEMKAKREAEEKKKALDALAHNDVRYRKYTIEEIEIATEFFADRLKIGEGGYGPVYKARLDHTPVAIKVLRPDAAQGRKQFQQEVEVLSCIRHPNMVLLLGACPEYGCLVYEYMDNGSLDDRLFRRGNTPSIPWWVRFKIAAEIATALLFLHQAKPEPLVHRDLKPANILLDRNYVSKISDVGLARLVPPSVANTVTQYRMTSTAGTFCYIDPEYQQTGMLGVKSDIYSLGILLLQIITAKPPMGLTHHVERAIDKGTFADLLDPTVPDWPVEDAMGYAKMALKCSELRRKDRPDLGTAVLPELNRLRNLGCGYGHEDFGLSHTPPSMSNASIGSGGYSAGSSTNQRPSRSSHMNQFGSEPRLSSPGASMHSHGSPFRSTEENNTRTPRAASNNGGRMFPQRLVP